MQKGHDLRLSIVSRAANNNSHQFHLVEGLPMSKAQKLAKIVEESCKAVRDSFCAIHNSGILTSGS